MVVGLTPNHRPTRANDQPFSYSPAAFSTAVGLSLGWRFGWP